MAGEHDDAISRVDDLMDTVRLNSVCYVVQACIFHSPTLQVPLTLVAGIHASPRGELTHGELQLRGCYTIIQTCAESTATPCESNTFCDLTGKPPNSGIVSKSKSSIVFDRYLVGHLMTSTSQFDSVFVKLGMPRVASRRLASIY